MTDRTSFCFEKWNLKDSIIFKPLRCSQSVMICLHGASFREQWNILLLLHRRNFRVFCLIIAVLKPTFYYVWKKAPYFPEERKPRCTRVWMKCPASETLRVYIVIFLHKKEMIMFNRQKTVLWLRRVGYF